LLEHHEFHPEPGLQGLGVFLPLGESISPAIYPRNEQSDALCVELRAQW